MSINLDVFFVFRNKRLGQSSGRRTGIEVRANCRHCGFLVKRRVSGKGATLKERVKSARIIVDEICNQHIQETHTEMLQTKGEKDVAQT